MLQVKLAYHALQTAESVLHAETEAATVEKLVHLVLKTAEHALLAEAVAAAEEEELHALKTGHAMIGETASQEQEQEHA